VRDVSDWLQGLGLGKYARVFDENDIDFEALRHLNENMLEKLGLPLGARAKLLAAISELASSPRSTRRQAPVERRPAERRQLTVMFCDLVDSTKMATGLDPEELRIVMEAYQRACGAVIQRYEGYVSQYRGDGLEVYFGWPVAHEDAAERAVRAGLEVVGAVKATASPVPLSVRVGIGTGIVVISETGFGDPAMPSGAVGDTPYIAARLQTLATPDSVVIAETTSRLISGRFDQEDLGLQNLKGIAEPIRAFRVRQVLEDSSRFQAAHSAPLTPLVDRRTELAWLQQRWHDAKDGEGQLVYVSGVAGVGKSRIVHELEQWIASEPHVTLRLQCLPHHMESALFPVIQLMQRLGQFSTDDSDQAKLDKVERLLSRTTQLLDKVVPFVADMISLPTGARYRPLALTAVQVKVQTLFVLVELLLGHSTRHPVLCVLEDAQWIDPSTQELLDLVAGRIEKSQILLVVTHRPDYQPQSRVHGNASALTISRLARRDLAEMAQLALRQQGVSNAVMKRIIDDSDSIPLYIEELARGVVDSESVDGRATDDHREEPPATWSVPNSLRDSLVARLDRAPQGRNVAQMAAVMGREFSYDMLLRISSLRHSELDSTLAHLQRCEIIQQIGDRPGTRYTFKHALVRDAAYESLLKSSRREIHARVGSTIEKEWPEIAAAQPELVAYHYSLAGDAEGAVRFWVQGGQRARSRSANIEATVQFQKALELLEGLPETRERAGMELEIQLSLGLCAIAVRGYSADETRKAFERARSLSVEVGDPHTEIQAIFGLWGHYWMRARHDRAIELGETLLAKAEEIRDLIAFIVGHRCLGSTLFTLGDFVRARDHLERAVALGQGAATDESSLSLSYAVDPRIAAQLMLAWDLWILGHPRQSCHTVLEALRQATERADPYTLAFAHYVTSVVQLLRGDFQESLAHADQSLAISKEHRINLYALYSRFGRGCALAKLKQENQAIIEIVEGIEEARRSNVEYMRGFMLGWLATMQAETGDPETALTTLDEALKQIDDVAGRGWEAELRRLYGDILLRARLDAVEEAERSYNASIAIAQNQRARSLELRATTSLSRLLRDQGRGDEARRRLALILGWFTDGFDTADLMEAKALLEELG
jgi:class 3 adenylate cyclase/tetratricopeptide (TPR) repeat protein